MMGWMKTGFALSTIVLAQLLTACGSARDPTGQTELQANAQAMVNGMQAELVGRFQSEMEGKSLRAELDNANLAMGTPVSFCLVTQSGSMPLAAAPITGGMGMGMGTDEVAEFEADSVAGQAVPNVVAGNKLEARQGTMASGMADCAAPLLVSAIFQPEVEPKR
jgi:hypothetical protein